MMHSLSPESNCNESSEQLQTCWPVCDIDKHDATIRTYYGMFSPAGRACWSYHNLDGVALRHTSQHEPMLRSLCPKSNDKNV